MSKTYAEIMAEIQALQELAKPLKEQAKKQALLDIKSIIDLNELTQADVYALFPGISQPSQPQSQRGSSKGKRGPLPPKYRDPVTQKTWAGGGLVPNWMKAYIAQGKTKEDFLI